MRVKPVSAGLLAALLAGTAFGAPTPGVTLDKAAFEKVQALLKERRDALREVLKGRKAQYEAGRISPGEMIDARRALLHAELDLATVPGRAVLNDALAKQVKEQEEYARALFETGRITPGEYAAARADCRAEEARLLRERAGARPTEAQTATLRKLQRERREVLTKALETQQKALIEGGRIGVDAVSTIARQKLEADLECAETQAERIAAHRTHLSDTQRLAAVLKEGFDVGRVNYYAFHRGKAENLTAEIGLLRAGGKLAPEAAGRVLALERECRGEWADVFKVALLQWEIGRPLDSDPPALSAALRDTELDIAEKSEDRIAAHRAHLKRVRQFEEFVKAQHDAGRLAAPDFFRVKAARLEAEAAFVRAGGKPADLGK
jgi:hypothetical protein